MIFLRNVLILKILIFSFIIIFFLNCINETEPNDDDGDENNTATIISICRKTDVEQSLEGGATINSVNLTLTISYSDTKTGSWIDLTNETYTTPTSLNIQKNLSIPAGVYYLKNSGLGTTNDTSQHDWYSILKNPCICQFKSEPFFN